MKNLKDFLISESQDNSFNFNISLFNNGKLEWIKLYKQIIKSINSKSDTLLSIDGGKLGSINVEFTNKNSNVCDLRISMKDLSKYVKFDKDVNDEFIEEKLPIKDAIIKMQNIINKIKESL